MRKTDSLFNKACQFINTVPVGSTFTSKEYISAIGSSEQLTWWKRISGNYHYNCHQYKGYLGRAGFITNTSRGHWRVERHIPSWFTLGHLQHILGYNYKGDTYKGKTRTDIMADLDHNAHHPNGVKKHMAKSLPKLYTFNQDVYDSFIGSCHTLEIDYFDSKNSLAAFIENIKWPGVGNNGVTPKFSVKGNYSPIIDHLIANGILTEKFDGYRYSYNVNLGRVAAAYHRYQDPEENISPLVESLSGVIELPKNAKAASAPIPNVIPSFAGTTVTQTFKYNTSANADAFFGTHPYNSGIDTLSELKKIEAELLLLTQKIQQIIKNLK